MLNPPSFESWAQELRDRLQAPLPGSTAHRRMIPRPRSPLPLLRRLEEARAAAVAVLLYPRPESSVFEAARDVRLILTRRPEGIGRHAGQICLPGGVLDPGESEQDAASREAHEEVGVDPQQVDWAGSLSSVFIPVSGFRMQPFVGVLARAPTLRPAPAEVEQVLEPSLAELGSPDSLRHRWTRRQGVDVFVPSFQLGGHEVWGATAMVLAELAEVLGLSSSGPVAGPAAGSTGRS